MRNYSRRDALYIAGLGVVTVFGATACSTTAPTTDTASTSASASAEDATITMKYIDINPSEVTSAQGDAMVTYAKDHGAELSVEYFNQNPATEQTLIENAVQAGVDVLIVHDQSENDCVDAINAAVDAGIPVLLYGTDVPDGNYTLLYGEDSYSAGQKMGEIAAAWAKENLVDAGKSVVCAMGTYSVTKIAVDRGVGAQDKLLEEIPDARIVGTYEMAYKEEGLKVGENLMQSDPDVNLVLAINDQSGLGVMEAIKAAGKGDDVIGIYGIDGTAEGMYNIAQGTLFKGTVAIPTNEVGEKLVQAGIDIIKGTSEYAVGSKTVLYWDSMPVDESNVDDYKDVWGSLAE
jgi:ABC-type sugar transport system substrate-binding protein